MNKAKIICQSFFIGLAMMVSTARAQEAKPLISYTDFVVLAKGALAKEAIKYNAFLSQKKVSKVEVQKAYGKKGRIFYKGIGFLRKIGIREIDPEYLINKCIFDQTDIANLLSPRLTLADDDTYNKKNSLNAVYELYGKSIYKVIYQLCNHAKISFADRLSSLKFANSSFGLRKEDRLIIERALFLPTIDGKRNLFDYLADRDIGVGIVVVTAAIGSAAGLVLPSVILSIIFVADEANSFIQSLKKIRPELYMQDFLFDEDADHALDTVFTDIEKNYVEKK